MLLFSLQSMTSAYLPRVTPEEKLSRLSDRKLGSHSYLRLCYDLSHLVEKFEPLQH